MTRLQIDFAPQRHWIWLWAATAAALLAISVGCGLYFAEKNRERIRLLGAASAADLQATALQNQAARAQSASQEPSQAGTKAASALLKVDLNALFGVLENVNEPGTRLVTANVDTVSQAVRIEYEVATLAHAAALTSTLNAGYDAPPWKFEAAAARDGAAAAGVMRASWSARLAQIR